MRLGAMARLFSRLLPPILAVGFCLALTIVALALLGYGRPDGGSFAAAVGALAKVVRDRSLLPGNNYRFWIQSLLSATPLILTGLAVAVAFRASVLNIGAEGQYVVGSIAATAVGVHLHASSTLAIPLLVAAAAAAGAVFAAIAVLLERWRNVPVVLSTLLLNFVALELLRTVLQGPLHEHVVGGGSVGQVQSDQLPLAARLAHVAIGGRLSDLHTGFRIALWASVFVAVVLRLTTFGFRLRAVGENAVAARFAGINVPRVALASLALSGGLAGLAGAVQVSGVRPYQLLLPSGFSGYGFTGIAVALLGRLSPVGVVIAAIFFGWLNTAFAQLQSQLHVPAITAQVAQGAILLTMLVLTQPSIGTRLRKLFPFPFSLSRNDGTRAG